MPIMRIAARAKIKALGEPFLLEEEETFVGVFVFFS